MSLDRALSGYGDDRDGVAALLKPDPGNDSRLQGWAQAAQAADLPNVHAVTHRPGLDLAAVTAAATLYALAVDADFVVPARAQDAGSGPAWVRFVTGRRRHSTSMALAGAGAIVGPGAVLAAGAWWFSRPRRLRATGRR